MNQEQMDKKAEWLLRVNKPKLVRLVVFTPTLSEQLQETKGIATTGEIKTEWVQKQLLRFLQKTKDVYYDDVCGVHVHVLSFDAEAVIEFDKDAVWPGSFKTRKAIIL